MAKRVDDKSWSKGPGHQAQNSGRQGTLMEEYWK